MHSTQFLTGNWANPNGKVLPPNPLIATDYYQIGSNTNWWRWDVPNQTWQPTATTIEQDIPPSNAPPTFTGEQKYHGPWDNPNGNLTPLNTQIANEYYKDGPIANVWRWDVPSQTWLPVVTPF